MATTTTQQLFDTRSQAEILRQRARQRYTEARDRVEQVGYESAAERQAGLLGGQIATALANRFMPPTLEESERNRVTAVEAAKKRFDDYRAANPEVSLEDLGLESQRYLAEELLKVNDPNGAQMASAYAETKLARDKAKLELRRLEGVADDEDTAREHWRVLNALKPVWLRTDNYLTPGRNAFILPDGSAELIGEDGQKQIIPRGQYSWTAPARPNQERGSTSIRELISPTNRLQLINMNAALGRQVDSYMTMWKTINEAATENGTVDFMSKSGGIQAWVTDWANTLASGARAIGSEFGVAGAGDLSRQSNAQAYVDKNPQLVEDLKQYMPADIATNGQRAARWASAATQLAFARGTSLEPGQRAMTDQDFQVQVKAIGAATSSPETFRQIALANMTSDIDNYETVLDGYYPDEQAMILNPSAIKRTRDKLDLFRKTFELPFGEADAPGPGLTGGERVFEYDPETGTIR